MAASLALLSAVLWGTADFAGGLLSRRIPAVAVVGWSQLAGLVSMGGVAVLTGAYGDPRGWALWAVLAGVSGATGLLAFYTALSIGTMGVVSPIAALGGAVPVVAGLLSGERPSRVQVVGILVALVGATAASGPELSGASLAGADGRRSVGLAALAGLLFGVTLVAIDGGSVSSPLMTLVGMRLVSALGFAVLGLVMASTGGVTRRDLPALAGVGVADAGANLAFGVASTIGLVSVVAVLAGLYPVATVLLALAVLRERLLRVQAVGVVAALVGVGLLAAG